MTTIAQVKKVTRPLLERNPDLSLVGRLVVITPVRHIVRGVFFEPGSNPVVFKPMWFVNFLFMPGAGLDETWSEPLYRKSRISIANDTREMVAIAKILSEQSHLPVRDRRYPEEWGSWAAYDPRIAIEMCEVFDEQVLPMLRAVPTIDDLITFASGPEKIRWGTPFGDHFYKQPYVYAAQGNFEAALAPCVRLASEYPNSSMVKEFLRLLTNRDRAGLAKRLHQWEAAAVKRMNLERFWEPTPFPLETTC